MTKFKKSARVALSVCLLLYFAGLTLSLDFLHHHNPEQRCRDSNGAARCSHRAHLSQDSSCWLCAAHIQHQATKTESTQAVPAEIPFIRILTENKLIGYVCERIIHLLRGPPIS